MTSERTICVREEPRGEPQFDQRRVVSTGVESSEACADTPFPFADALGPEGFESARARFLKHFGEGAGPVVVDLSEASEVGLFGLQVLVGAAKWAAARDREFSTVGAPASLGPLCAALGLEVAGIEERSP